MSGSSLLAGGFAVVGLGFGAAMLFEPQSQQAPEPDPAEWSQHLRDENASNPTVWRYTTRSDCNAGNPIYYRDRQTAQPLTGEPWVEYINPRW